MTASAREGPGGEPPECPPGWTTGPPDFVGVGAESAGTTWWYSLLARHPGVHSASSKELHFFRSFWKGGFSDADITSYHRQFPRPPGQITGEWTVRYMYDPWIPRLLAAAAPEAKILVLLRDPVDRYRSAIVRRSHRRKDRIGPTVVTEALARSLYVHQLQRLFHHFARDQVLVLQYERCRVDHRAQLRRTHEFLGLQPADFVPAGALDRQNPAPVDLELSPETKEDLVVALGPDVQMLAGLVPEIDLSLWPSVRDALRM
jgi:sulfotransferase family protein